MSMSQITEFAYPCALDRIYPDNPTAFKNATRQTSRGLSALYKASLIDYRHAKGTSPNCLGFDRETRSPGHGPKAPVCN